MMVQRRRKSCSLEKLYADLRALQHEQLRRITEVGYETPRYADEAEWRREKIHEVQRRIKEREEKDNGTG